MIQFLKSIFCSVKTEKPPLKSRWVSFLDNRAPVITVTDNNGGWIRYEWADGKYKGTNQKDLETFGTEFRQIA